jgi:hypothetical protein
VTAEPGRSRAGEGTDTSAGKLQGHPPAGAEKGGPREELIRQLAAHLEERLTAPAALLAARDPGIWHQRALSDALGQAARWIRAARKYLDGDYDSTYPGPHEPLYTTLQEFREHYAADSPSTTWSVPSGTPTPATRNPPGPPTPTASRPATPARRPLPQAARSNADPPRRRNPADVLGTPAARSPPAPSPPRHRRMRPARPRDVIAAAET